MGTPSSTSTECVGTRIDAWLWPLLAQYAPLRPVPLCPDLKAFHAEDELPLWQAIEATTGSPTEAPFYAVAWPGAQAIARALADQLVSVRDQRVVDVGCGGGLLAVAAAARGAAHVTAIDVDPLALSTSRALAATHGVTIETRLLGLELDATVDLASSPLGAVLAEADVLLVADLVYSRALGDALRRTLNHVQTRHPGTTILVADSGRPYFAESVERPCALRAFAQHEVPVPRSVEGRDTRLVRVYGMPLR